MPEVKENKITLEIVTDEFMRWSGENNGNTPKYLVISYSDYGHLISNMYLLGKIDSLIEIKIWGAKPLRTEDVKTGEWFFI